MEGKKKTLNKMTFEEALSELEGIAIRLEEGSMGLDESIVEFERGSKLAKLCQSKLEEAGKKIEILQKGEELKDGNDTKKKKVKRKKVKVNQDTGEIDNDEDLQGSLL